MPSLGRAGWPPEVWAGCLGLTSPCIWWRPGRGWMHQGWPGLPSSPLGNGCVHEAGPTWREGVRLGVGAWSWGCWVGEGSSAHPTRFISQPPHPRDRWSQQTIPSVQKPGKAVISQLTSMLMKIISTSWGLRNRCKGFIKCCGGVGREGWRRGRLLLPGKPQRHREEETEMERETGRESKTKPRLRNISEICKKNSIPPHPSSNSWWIL